jgi:hypothetical protein
MKTAFILFFILVLMALKADAAAPYGIKGQGQAGTLYSNVHQFPNNQVTNLGGINALVETGNEDILANGSFEHLTYNTGWTNVGGTLTVETGASNIKSGLKAAKLVTAADNVEFYQDSTLYASSSLGVAGTISGWISNTAPNVYFCQRIAGAWVDNTDGTGITNCRLVNQTGVFTEYSMPVIFGATSNGAGFISLTPSTAATVTTTGTTYFDKIKVAAGQSFTATANDTDWASCGHTTSDFTGFGTVSAIETQCKRQGSDLLMRGKFVSGTTTITEARINLKLGGSSLTSAATTKIPSIASFGRAIRQSVSATGIKDFVILQEPSVAYFTIGHPEYTQTISPFTKANGTGIMLTGEAFSFNASIPINGWDVSSSATSQAADSFSTGTNVLTHKTTAIVASDPVGTYNTYSYTTSTNATRTICATPPTTLPSTINGILVFSRVYASAGTCNLPARYEIKIGTGMTNIQKDIYKAVSKSNAGNTDYITNASTVQYGFIHKDYEADTGILTMDSGETWSSAVTTAAFMFNDSTTQTSAYLVINAQKNKDFMVGNISGLEKCATTLECTDTFSASISSGGVVSGENVDWISGNCGTGNPSTCTFNTGIFTVAPNCTAVSQANRFMRTTSAAANLTNYTYDDAGVLGALAAVTVNCQKQGADYIGKTAKAVASDQNTRVPGMVNSVEYMATGTCSSSAAFTSQDGGTATSIANITSGYCTVTLPATMFSLAPKCFMTFGGQTSAANIRGVGVQVNSATSFDMDCNTGAADCTTFPFNLLCKGTKP